MAVNYTSKQYDARRQQWQRCRDASAGADAIKAGAQSYLPKLKSQDPDEYESYKQRAMWYGATARTVQGLVGAVTRKDPHLEVPDAMAKDMDDVTLTGMPAKSLIKHTIQELLVSGRHGILVEMSDTQQRPYLVSYATEEIVNWRSEMVNGLPKLTLVVLAEKVEAPGTDYFETKEETQYRVLRLIEGVYHVETWKATKGDSGTIAYALSETATPTVRGSVWTEIPFCFFGAHGLEPEPCKPPLLDMVDVNVSHYCNSADHEHGMHFTALPTPWVAGFPKATVLKIGSSTAWVATDPNASAGMLEFKGDGLGTLERSMDRKERLMAVLGARMLEEQKMVGEAAETVALRGHGERSVMQSMAVTVSLGWTRLLRWHARWRGIRAEENVMVTLNTDFEVTKLSGTDLTALVQAFQSAAISFDTFYFNLQRGELARPGVDAEEERTLIEATGPGSVGMDLNVPPVDDKKGAVA